MNIVMGTLGHGVGSEAADLGAAHPVRTDRASGVTGSAIRHRELSAGAFGTLCWTRSSIVHAMGTKLFQ